MTLQAIQESLPSYAKDIKLNLSSLINSDTPLTPQQKWGTMLACAMTTKNRSLLNAVSEQAEINLTPEAFSAAKGAAALMGMNNIYYRFTHLVSNTEYSKMPANLRMSLIAQPGIDKLDFELFSLAVSAINGCGLCIDSHEKVLSSKGINKEIIQSAVRIASIINAVATVLQTEELS
jgi:alkyl hydroperoxide reductase subunit D